MADTDTPLRRGPSRAPNRPFRLGLDNRTLARGAIAAALLGIAGAGIGSWQHAHPAAWMDANPAPLSGGPEMFDPTGGTTGPLPGFAAIVERYGPAVVNIQVTGDMHPDQDDTDVQDDPLFRFFPRFGLPIPRQPVPSRGEGSGFIISPDGLILTNAHVVDGAREVTVKLTDRREFRARVRGVDRPSDVAVLKIDAEDLPIVHLGRADPVRVGEWVLAIGSPFGFQNSASAGIVSAKARALPDEGYVPFIQTDVAVNPGNSGGPLFNTRGDVVGINSQIYSRTGGYQGLSFAIPIEVAIQVKDQILRAGKVTRGRLGVSIQDVDQGLAASFRLKKPAGALISSVEPGSPADKAGLREGDVILEVNGRAVDTSDLPPAIATLTPGSTAVLAIWHDGSQHKVAVQVGEFVQAARHDRDDPLVGGRLGLAIRPLGPAERRAAGIADGLLVVAASGPAARAGIEDGDVILSLNGTAVHRADDLRRLASRAGRHVALLVLRGEARLFVPLDLG